MSVEWRQRWDGYWFAPEPARNIAVARIILALTALWIVLSRRDLPAVLEFPPEMLEFATLGVRLRFAIVFPIAVERSLYALLHLSLICVTLGYRPRVTAFMGGLFLYHFQPFETLMWTTNPYLRGLTIPALGLLILAFFPEIDRARFRILESLPRWPLLLVQWIVVEIYFFAGYSKLITSGVQWMSHDNMRRWLLLLEQTYQPSPHPIGYQLASIPGVPEALGWAGILFELLFPVTMVWRRSRIVFIPLAIMFHLANAVMFHIVFQELPVLLLFVNWSAMSERIRK